MLGCKGFLFLNLRHFNKPSLTVVFCRGARAMNHTMQRVWVVPALLLLLLLCYHSSSVGVGAYSFGSGFGCCSVGTIAKAFGGFDASRRSVRRPAIPAAASTPTTEREEEDKTPFPKERLFVEWMTSDSLVEIPHPGIPLEVIGSNIPSYVNGVYVKNGPGAFATPDGSRRYTHAFDGLAKLQKFDITGGGGGGGGGSNTTHNAAAAAATVTFTTRFIDSFLYHKMMRENTIPGHISTGPVDPPFELWDVLWNTLSFDNTCVTIEEVSSSGIVCAGTDAAVRQQIDIRTLETIGRMPQHRIHGIRGMVQFSSAHGKVRHGLSYNYYLENAGLFGNWAHIVRTNQDLSQTSIGKIQVLQGQTPTQLPYVHEISVTDNFAILVLCPLVIDLGKVLQTASLMPTMEFQPTQSTKIYVFDLNNNDQRTTPVQVFEAPALFCYHHVNAYETNPQPAVVAAAAQTGNEGSNGSSSSSSSSSSSNSIILDLLAYDEPGIINGPHAFLYMDNMKTEETRMKQERAGTVWRFTLDLNNATTATTAKEDRVLVQPEKLVVVDPDTRLPWNIELTSIAPNRLGKPYRYVYGHTGFYQGLPGFMDWAILKQDVGPRHSGSSCRSSSTPRHGVWYEEFMYPGEVTFVADPNGVEEDDGVLLSTVYDSRRKENCLLVLDASSLTELARAYTGIDL